MTHMDSDLQAYDDHLVRMLDESHAGQYVVIKDASPQAFFDSYEAALDWAYGRFGLGKIFVKRVALDHDVAHFTRDIGPCPA